MRGSSSVCSSWTTFNVTKKKSWFQAFGCICFHFFFFYFFFLNIPDCFKVHHSTLLFILPRISCSSVSIHPWWVWMNVGVVAVKLKPFSSTFFFFSDLETDGDEVEREKKNRWTKKSFSKVCTSAVKHFGIIFFFILFRSTRSNKT